MCTITFCKPYHLKHVIRRNISPTFACWSWERLVTGGCIRKDSSLDLSSHVTLLPRTCGRLLNHSTFTPLTLILLFLVAFCNTLSNLSINPIASWTTSTVGTTIAFTLALLFSGLISSSSSSSCCSCSPPYTADPPL